MANSKRTKKGAKKGAKKSPTGVKRTANDYVTMSLPQPVITFLEHLRWLLITEAQGKVELNQPMAQALCDAIGGADSAVLRRELDRAFVSFRPQGIQKDGVIP